MLKERLCPRCGKTYIDYSAISRSDNKTEICQICAQAEALLRYIGKPDIEWKIKKIIN